MSTTHRHLFNDNDDADTPGPIYEWVSMWAKPTRKIAHPHQIDKPIDNVT